MIQKILDSWIIKIDNNFLLLNFYKSQTVKEKKIKRWQGVTLKNV